MSRNLNLLLLPVLNSVLGVFDFAIPFTKEVAVLCVKKIVFLVFHIYVSCNKHMRFHMEGIPHFHMILSFAQHDW
jgi:hypothetical protein